MDLDFSKINKFFLKINLNQKKLCHNLVKLISYSILVLGPGHVTFWTLSTGSENTAQDLGDRLRATEGRFMMTAVADVESVAATGSTGKTISFG